MLHSDESWVMWPGYNNDSTAVAAVNLSPCQCRQAADAAYDRA